MKPSLLNGDITAEDARRFWLKVRHGGERDSEQCWIWLGGCDNGGYGHLWFDGRTWKAHRFSWLLHFGPIPQDMLVLHTCDNPPCVHPGHLWLGTHKDNHADRDAKGRHARRGPNNPATGKRNGAHTQPERRPRGERHGRSRFTEADVMMMRRRHANGEEIRAIADDLGLREGTVRDVVTRRRWAWL